MNKTSAEVLKLLNDIGHASTFIIKVDGEERDVLNDAVVYREGHAPCTGSNEENAVMALKEIKKSGKWFRVRSNGFEWANGEYNIVD